MKKEYPFKKVEAHIVLTCSDARDRGPIYYEEDEKLREEYKKRKIKIAVMELPTPGAYITPGKGKEIIRAVKETLKRYKKAPQIEVYVDFFAHGEVVKTENFGKKNVPRIYWIKAERESGYTCGMSNAVSVAAEIERMLITAGGINFNGKRNEIKKRSDIKKFLKKAYGYNGPFAGGLVKNLQQPLSFHIARQMDKIIDDLKKAGIKNVRVTAAVHDYSNYEIFRVDELETKSFLDEAHQRASRRLAKMEKSKREKYVATRTEPQKPSILLVHGPRVRNARMRTAREIHKREPTAGEVFAICGMGFLDKRRKKLEPYDIVGIFYALEHLKVDRVIIRGKTEEETELIMKKLRADPLVNMIIEKFGVQLESYQKIAGLMSAKEEKKFPTGVSGGRTTIPIKRPALPLYA